MPKPQITSWWSQRLGHWVAVCEEYPDLSGSGHTRLAASLDLATQIRALGVSSRG